MIDATPAWIRQRVNEIQWFHSLELGHGVRTPGIIDSQKVLGRVNLPEQLAGKSVLDVGAWDGFYAFEAEKRGAQRVLATDHFCWSGDGWGTKRGFDLAHELLESQVESRDIDIMDLSPDAIGVFDVVLFLGVLYHMRHPMLALEKVASVAGDLLILETSADLTNCRRPALAFYQEGQLNNDGTNWFGPNEPAIHAMLKAVGFRKVQTVYRPSIGHRFHRLRRTLTGRPEGGRIAVHAWK